MVCLHFLQMKLEINLIWSDKVKKQQTNKTQQNKHNQK